MSAEGNFEKTRIVNPNEAQEIANMLSVEAGEKPTAGDYDAALEWLQQLEEEADRVGDGISNERLREIVAGFVAAGGAAMDLVALSILAAGTTVGPYPKHLAEKSRQELVERLKKVAADYHSFKDLMMPARERLEKWKAEAGEFSKKQTEPN